MQQCTHYKSARLQMAAEYGVMRLTVIGGTIFLACWFQVPALRMTRGENKRKMSIYF